MRRTFVLALFVAAAAVVPPAVPAVADGEDDSVRLEADTGPFVAFKDCYRQLVASEQRPASVKDAPEGVDRWLVFPWGEGEAIVGVSPEQLWPDTDGDGDLAEETAVAIERGKPPEVGFDLALPSGTIRATLRLKSYRYGTYRITNLTRMSGTVRVGEREVAVSLTDYMANGRYDDLRTTTTPEYWLCDHIHFDLDGDGKFKRYIPPSGEDFSLAKAFVFDGAAYACEVLDRGERLRFAPTGEALAEVEVNTPACVLRLVSDRLGAFSVRGTDGIARMPAGRYRLDACEYDVGEGRVRGLFWEEDGEKWLDVVDGLELGMAGEMRYDLFAELDEEGVLRFRSICFGPLGDRVMVYPLRGSHDSIKPELTVEADQREVLYRVTSRYC